MGRGVSISELRKCYYEASDKVSSLVRQLSFSGVAVIWLFTPENGSPPRDLLCPLILLVAALGFDFLQYIWKTIYFAARSHYLEEKWKDVDHTELIPHWVNWTSLAFFWSKVGVMFFAYIFLLSALIPRVVA